MWTVREIVICLVLLVGCRVERGEPGVIRVTDRESAKQVEDLWAARSPTAYFVWSKVDDRTQEGRRIRRLLRQADVHYREGLRLFEKGETAMARLAFQRGAAVGPINPEHYYTLAELYRKRGKDESASEYYVKYARGVPDSEKSRQAVALAKRFDPSFDGMFDPPTESVDSAGLGTVPKFNVFFLLAGAFIGGALVLLLLFVVRPYFGRGTSLTRLIDQAPELHSGIAYLIGSLRHELLKHRIGVVGDVLSNLKSSNATGPQQAFLGKRLYSGVPVDEAWRSHLSAFGRALGNRFNFKRDRRFRRADRAIRSIAAAETVYEERGTGALAVLNKAHLQLKQFDSYLANEQRRLVRTLVDTALLTQVVEEVRGEYAASSVPISIIDVEDVKVPVSVEVPRVDLLLILKNLFRNAVMAVGESPSPRKVAISTGLNLEPTGEESVRIRVFDSSQKKISITELGGANPGSGLALVMTAIKRYGGALDVEDAGDEGKTVVIRFFRAFEDDGEVR